MLADWSAECSHDAPAIVVPWRDPDGGPAHFVNLHAEPYDIAEIPEAEAVPALGRALRALNTGRSPVLTSKCDAYPLASPADDATLDPLRLELDLEPEDARFGFAGYIDLLWRERAVFASPHQQTDRLDRLMRRTARLPHAEAAVQAILRPAIADLTTPLEGFATTLFLTALAGDPETARQRWSAALADLTTLLRSRDFELPRGSATID